ncbi:Hypothetical predicted protein [Mytilus galloprovincialis]|uniref:ZMYM2-like/QRICH1 C-terminal domain-containing protein n=1 Tax=Mytilus galloprovincialis TaxID=29158 RepID=A0A8B6GB21_MYTGA|nr:Hypothetical predicted protein [Mytilus galloprovincialis]
MAGVHDESTENVKKPRFASINDDKYQQILREKDSINTQKATKRAIKLFINYLEEKDLPSDIENFPVNELDRVLSKFYAEARNKNGELYKMFKAMSVQVKSDGLGEIEHYPPIEEDHSKTIYSSLTQMDPVSLQQKVFIDLMLYFGRRGRENLRDLKVKDFEFSKQGGGDKEHRYIRKQRDELTKNHKEDTKTAVGKMYRGESLLYFSDDAKCPVKSFIKYTTKLNTNCEYFFQRPKTTINDDSVWYDASPLGHNTLGAMMPAICEKAGLGKRYTNHSLRATTVHVLDEADFAGRHIMSVTGHKSENSLKTYTGFTSDRALHNMSNVISESLRTDATSTTSTAAVPDRNVEDMFQIENDSDIIDFMLLSDSQMNNLCQDITSTNSSHGPVAACEQQQVNVNKTATYSSYPCINNFGNGYPNYPVITNNYGNININYNIIPK